jgi:hypothetical protein
MNRWRIAEESRNEYRVTQTGDVGQAIRLDNPYLQILESGNKRGASAEQAGSKRGNAL